MAFEPRRIPERSFRPSLLLSGLCVVGLMSGCSTVKKAAVSSLADTLAQGGSSFSSDEDPELVKDAAPFSLKLMESVLAENPTHQGLLEATAAGFTQYAYAFVVQEADEVESLDLARAEQQRQRAKKLFLRAHAYALKGLEQAQPGFQQALATQPVQAAAKLNKEQAGLLYWASASLGAAIAVGKDDPALVAQLPIVEALIDRALVVDEAWGGGAVHAFLISYEASRQGAQGEASQRSSLHYRRALELSGGQQAGPHVSYAEAVCIEKQDTAEFERVLNLALAVDASAKPEWRLANQVMQRRARWLLSRKEDLFFKPGQ